MMPTCSESGPPQVCFSRHPETKRSPGSGLGKIAKELSILVLSVQIAGSVIQNPPEEEFRYLFSPKFA